MEEIDVDNFAGGGGASTGIVAATGRPVTLAINHSPAAIAGRLLWVIPLHRVAGRECPGNTHREAPRG